MQRQVPQTAEKILDAPDMLNDFYLHLIDWSSLNHMAVALGGGLYIWNATDGSILQLFEKEGEEEYICSVSWIKVREGLDPLLCVSVYVILYILAPAKQGLQAKKYIK